MGLSLLVRFGWVACLFALGCAHGRHSVPRAPPAEPQEVAPQTMPASCDVPLPKPVRSKFVPQDWSHRPILFFDDVTNEQGEVGYVSSRSDGIDVLNLARGKKTASFPNVNSPLVALPNGVLALAPVPGCRNAVQVVALDQQGKRRFASEALVFPLWVGAIALPGVPEQEHPQRHQGTTLVGGLVPPGTPSTSKSRMERYRTMSIVRFAVLMLTVGTIGLLLQGCSDTSTGNDTCQDCAVPDTADDVDGHDLQEDADERGPDSESHT